MVYHLESPAAVARLLWLPEREGGRSAPPHGPAYAATVAFADSNGESDHRGWHLGPHDLSIILEFVGPVSDGAQEARVGFIAPEIAAPRLAAHDNFIVFEGARRVALGTILERYTSAPDS